MANVGKEQKMEERYLTDNGIEIFGYKNPHLHGFFISLFLRAGSMYESERDNGITHFFEHVSIRNVNKLMGGGLYSALDRNGVEFNASTYSEMVQFYVSGATDKFGFAAEVLSKLFSPIALDSGEIDLERRRIKAEIRESDDRNSLLSFSNRVVHSGTSLERSITGSLGTVSAINAKRLEEYRKRTFTKDNVFLYVTGNYSDSDIEGIRKLFSSVGELPVGEAHNNVAPVSVSHFSRSNEVNIKSSDYTMVRFTFDIDMSKVSVPETDLIYDMLLSGYDSPFFIEMSEHRGLFYDLTGAVERYRNIGELYFSYEVKRQDLEKALSLTVELLNKFKKTVYPDGALMKCGYVDNAYMLYDDSRELNFTFAYDNHVMGLGYASLDERRRAYESVGGEDIKRAANEIFKRSNLTFTMKGDKKKTDSAAIEKILAGLEN